MKGIIAGMVGAVFSVGVIAADANGSYTVYGAGATTCGTVIKNSRNGTIDVYESSWLNGYLTGINFMVDGLNDISGGVDNNGRALWIYNYCKKNPLNDLSNAASSLALELAKTKAK